MCQNGPHLMNCMYLDTHSDMGLLIARSGQTPWLLRRQLPCSYLPSPALPPRLEVAAVGGWTCLHDLGVAQSDQSWDSSAARKAEAFACTAHSGLETSAVSLGLAFSPSLHPGFSDADV